MSGFQNLKKEENNLGNKSQEPSSNFKRKNKSEGYFGNITNHASLDLSSSNDNKESKVVLRSKSLNSEVDGEKKVDSKLAVSESEKKAKPLPQVGQTESQTTGISTTQPSPLDLWQAFKARCTSASSASNCPGKSLNDPVGSSNGSPSRQNGQFQAGNITWSFMLSLHQLIMMSNIQSLIFGTKSSQQKPSIQPNEFLDGMIDQMKQSMIDRGVDILEMPDQDVGVVLLSDGYITGLNNLERCGDAILIADKDHFLLTFALQLKDLTYASCWKKKRLKGKVSAMVSRMVLNLQMKQFVPMKNPPELEDLKVHEIVGIYVAIHGLGPLNWLVKKVLRAFLRRHLKTYLEQDGRDLIEHELKNMSINWEGDQSYWGILG